MLYLDAGERTDYSFRGNSRQCGMRIKMEIIIIMMMVEEREQSQCTHLHMGSEIYECGFYDVGLGMNLAEVLSQLRVLG